MSTITKDNFNPNINISIHNKEALIAETIHILDCFPFEINIDKIVEAINDIEDIFLGKYSGYKACNIKYHDLNHTYDVYLAMLRIIYGAFLDKVELTKSEIELGLILALFHDTGYIQKDNEIVGTGAQFTLIHIKRSYDFFINYSNKKNVSFNDKEKKCIKNILDCTGFSTEISNINFSDKKNELLGKMLGTADLIGQMADRNYVEKLSNLYDEFEEASIGGYRNEFDLLVKTINFFKLTEHRLITQFDNVRMYTVNYFKKRWNINTDLYSDQISANKIFLKKVINKPNYKKYLNRHNE